MTEPRPPAQSPPVESVARIELPSAVPLRDSSGPALPDGRPDRRSVTAPPPSPSPPPFVTDRVPHAPPSASIDFRAIYDAEFDYVHRSLRRLGVPDRDLEDLCHDVFVAFHRGLDHFDPSRPIRPWLFGIAFRVASDHRRRARHRYEQQGMEADAADGLLDARPNAEERVAEGQQRALVRAALATLDLDRRAVLVMHDLDGQTMPEIAEALGVPLNTAYSRLRLAREQFAKAVRRLLQKIMNEVR